MRLLLASNNLHKIREIQEIFLKQDIGNIDLLTPNDVLSEEFDVEEDGTTFRENAFKKSDFYFNLTQTTTIADDSGLEIDALSGMPGVNSARFSGVHGNDELNRKKVLQLLKDTPAEQRTARFRTVICYRSKESTLYFEGICNGIITNEEKGENGFGYDPIFIPYSHTSTFAEMNAEEKNGISHRTNAVIKLGEYLRNLEN